MIRKITITLQSPFMLGGIEVADASLDARTMMSEDGRAMMAGSALKGLVRDALRRLNEAEYDGPDIIGLFGDESRKGSGNEPNSGHLHFSDLIASTGTSNVNRTTRICIDPETGSADEGALLVAELAALPGAEIALHGRFQYTGDEAPAKVQAWIENALACIEYVGQWRHIGFGKLSSYLIEAEDTLPEVSYVAPTEKECSYMVVELDGPFLVSAQRNDDNSFAGEDIIPGGALKGAIADQLSTEIGSELSALTFAHGFPIIEEFSEPQPLSALPCSAVLLRGEKTFVFNAMTMPQGPVVLDGGHVAMNPAFAIDWKPEDEEYVDAQLKRAKLSAARQQRTRAAIAGDTGTAEAGKLFSQEAVCPWLEGDSTKKLRWAFRISGSETYRAKLAEAIEHKRFLIGKLKTGLRVVEWLIGDKKAPGYAKTEDRLVAVLTLETPALMSPLSLCLTGDAWACYEAYFESLAPWIELEDFYARQRQITGYQAIRFQAHPKRFEPWVLTETGATFRISAPITNTVDFEALINEWQSLGLPPAHAVPSGSDAWQVMPFPRENGYGAVTIIAPKLPVPLADPHAYPADAWWRLEDAS